MVVTRYNPQTRDAVVLVSHTAFGLNDTKPFNYSLPLNVYGKVREVILEARMGCAEQNVEFNEDDDFITGLSNYSAFNRLQEHVCVSKGKMIQVDS